MANSLYSVDNPVMIDRVIKDMQESLIKLPWLNVAFGRAQTHRQSDNKKKIPVFYQNKKRRGSEQDYIALLPDSQIGSFCFFYVEDPQTYEWSKLSQGKLTCEFSIIFWFDTTRVFGQRSNRNTEQLKWDIIRQLKSTYFKSASIKIEKIYEKCDEIYRGYDVDEVANQFMMHPYGGFRFEGTMMIQEECV